MHFRSLGGLAAVIAAVVMMAGLAVRLPVAAADPYGQVLHSFQTHNGTVPACAVSSHELIRALKGQDTYSAQYAGDLTQAIQNALAQRASGACGPKRTLHAGTAKVPAAGRPQSNARSRGANPNSVPLVSVTGATSGELPAPIALMAAFAALLALLGALLGVAHIRGWDPAWAAWWRHAWSEAGYRMGGAGEDLADRLHMRRQGRQGRQA